MKRLNEISNSSTSRRLLRFGSVARSSFKTGPSSFPFCGVMDSSEQETNGTSEADALLPTPPVSSNVTPIQAVSEPVKKRLRMPMVRRGLGTKGQKIQLLPNHFKVAVKNVNDQFFHYSVAISYEDSRPVDAKDIGRRILDRVHDTYDTELAGKEFAYDGEKSLFSIGALPRNKLEFTIVLKDFTSSRFIFLDLRKRKQTR